MVVLSGIFKVGEPVRGDNFFRLIAIVLLLGALLGATPKQESLLQDLNGDGEVRLLAFGDSITAGVGDGIPPGEYVPSASGSESGGGYPARLQDYLNVPVQNAGNPGEDLAERGVFRLVSTVLSSNADVVILYEGVNDSWSRTTQAEFKIALQKAINVLRALDKTTVVATLLPPCCDYSSLAYYASGYTAVIRDLARINQVPLAELDKTWLTSCSNPLACEFYNLPEGLHPNTLGYDAVAQTFAAKLLGINVYSASGAADLESATGLPAGSVIVKPEVVNE